jgi:hypothetical protein
MAAISILYLLAAMSCVLWKEYVGDYGHVMIADSFHSCGNHKTCPWKLSQQLPGQQLLAYVS